MRTLGLLVLGVWIALQPAAAGAFDWGAEDHDEDGFSPDDGDCNDGDPDINPGVREVCDDEIDNDCDLAIDFDDPECTACGACAVAQGGPGPAAVIPVLALAWLLGWRRARSM